jgi:hypothetical protein
MQRSKHHVGHLTEDSVAKMRKSPGALFVAGLVCFDCGSPFVIGTLNLEDYPVATGHTIAEPTAPTTIALARRLRPASPGTRTSQQ